MALTTVRPEGLGFVNGRRNLIINGAMQVAQRGTSETGITATKYANAPDRFNLALGSAGTWTAAQSTDAPVGFSNSYRLDCTTADASLGGGDLLILQQAIEGQNLQHLKKGTSSAESVTVSFHVKSNKTGTYIAELFDADNSRQISQAYTISSANTWEKKTLTYAGDTSGALDNDNASSLYLVCWLAAGSAYTSGTLSTSWTAFTQADRAVGLVNLADSTDNNWSITGVQLEVGEQATPFEHRSFSEELNSCKRYYQTVNSLSSYSFVMVRHTASANYYSGGHHFSPELRAAPSITFSTSGTFIHKPSRRNDSGSSAGTVQDKNQFTIIVNPTTDDTDAYLAYLNGNVTLESEL
tara:strand:- start:188 stop:1249 length:1062 start_codon:yes stop_codon:yes gene_type:complete